MHVRKVKSKALLLRTIKLVVYFSGRGNQTQGQCLLLRLSRAGGRLRCVSTTVLERPWQRKIEVLLGKIYLNTSLSKIITTQIGVALNPAPCDYRTQANRLIVLTNSITAEFRTSTVTCAI